MIRGKRSRPVILALATGCSVLTLAGCGGSRHYLAGAEPAHAPAILVAPAGRSALVGNGPEGIVVDPRTGLAVVGLRGPAQLVMVNARSGRVVRRVSIPGAPRHLQLAAGGGAVLVPEEPVDSVLEVSLPSGRFRSIKVGASPHDATEDSGRVFVGNEFARSVSVIQGTRVVREIGGFTQPGGLAAAGPDVAVVDVGADSVTLIDAGTLHEIGRVSAGAGPTHVVADAGGRVYVIDTRGNAVLTFATRPKLRRLGRFPLTGTPYGVAIDPARERLWVTLTARNQVVEFDITGGLLRRVSTYATARQPNTVAVDEATGSVFVADSTAGAVQLIEPRR